MLAGTFRRFLVQTKSYERPLTVTVKQAAALLNCSEDLIRASIKRRELPAVQFGRKWLIPKSALHSLGRGERPEVTK
jgi:excisionase family DNA binding protein